MRLTVFQSDKGDCLMLRAGETRMLVDGGMRTSYTKHVAPTLDKLRQEKKAIDLIYTSHIDRDHVFGLLQLLDDLVAWRVFDFHQTSPNGNRNRKMPKVLRPPEIKGIWHNAFHRLVEDNIGPIGDLLAARAMAFTGFTSAGTFHDPEILKQAERAQNFFFSMGDAFELSKRINADQLNIPLNHEFGGKLAMVRENQDALTLGDMNIHVIGPFEKDLEKLRKGWNKWAESAKGKKHLARLARKHKKADDILGLSDAGDVLAFRRKKSEELGLRSNVTAPNLASLMLYVEKDGKDILLTGDGHWKDILAGLEHIGKLEPDGGLHVNILKVPHHGSEHNAKAAFGKRITADHYVFCSNGAHENPDLRILKMFVKSRSGPEDVRSTNPETGNPYKFWFNSSSNNPDGKTKDLAHMKDIEEKMVKHKECDPNLNFQFLDTDKFEIQI